MDSGTQQPTMDAHAQRARELLNSYEQLSASDLYRRLTNFELQLIRQGRARRTTGSFETYK